jgi:hypothetical protein
VSLPGMRISMAGEREGCLRLADWKSSASEMTAVRRWIAKAAVSGTAHAIGGVFLMRLGDGASPGLVGGAATPIGRR